MYGNNTYGNTGYGTEQGSGQGKVIGGPIRLDLLMSQTKIKAKVKPSGQHLSYNLLESKFMKSPYFFNLKETALRYLSQTGELKIGSVTLTPPVISLSGEEVKKINVKYKTRPDKTELLLLPLAVDLKSEYRVTTSQMEINSEVSDVSSIYDQKIEPPVIYSGPVVFGVNIHRKQHPGVLQLQGEVSEAEIFRPEYRISWEQGGPGFIENDLIIAQRSDYDAEGVLKELYKIKARIKNVPVEGMADLEIVNDDGTAYRDFENNSDGIEFIRVGNTEDTGRQGLVMITSDTTHAPYIDVKGEIDSFNKYEFGLPKVRLGNLAGIDDPAFGNISGYGLYAENAYLKGKMIITNPEDIKSSQITDDAGWSTTVKVSKNNTVPPNPTVNDIWYDTSLENTTLKFWNGSSWEIIGVNGTKIDGDGIYTGTLNSQQVNAVGINAESIVGGTLTGVTLQTSTGPNKIVVSGTNAIEMFANGRLVGNISGFTSIGMQAIKIDGHILHYGWMSINGNLSVQNGINGSITATNGTSGTFTSADGKVITVTDGIVTDIN